MQDKDEIIKVLLSTKVKNIVIRNERITMIEEELGGMRMEIESKISALRKTIQDVSE